MDPGQRETVPLASVAQVETRAGLASSPDSSGRAGVQFEDCEIAPVHFLRSCCLALRAVVQRRREAGCVMATAATGHCNI